jgi:hypothetical protein
MVGKTKVFHPVIGILTVFGVLGTASVVLAEPTTDPSDTPVVDPNAGFSSPEGGSGLFDDASGPMDLIHRAVLMNDMSLSEFRQQQQGRLADEAANFRLLQQEALQRQELEAVDVTEDADPEAEL